MDSGLQWALDAGGVVVCVKDSNKRVLSQNEYCRRLCGEREGEVCETGCMELYNRDSGHQWKDWGCRLYRNSFLHGGFFDVMLVCNAGSIITLLQPLKEKYEAALAYYREKGLTRRESEVVFLSIRGLTNTDICKSLSISRATLRTHLNNVYRKFRDLGEIPEFMPANRIIG